MAADGSRRDTFLPLAVGIAAMLMALVDVSWLSGTVLLFGAFVLGFLFPESPVRTAALVVVPAVVGGLLRTLVDDPGDLGALALSAVGGLAFAMVATHVGGGIALRRRPVPQR